MPRPARIELAACVGRENAARLREAGVADLAWLLRIARTPEGRTQLTRHTKIPEEALLRWAHLADLCRIPSLEPENASLLQEAGVRGLRDLVACDATALCRALRRLEARVRPVPRTVAGWIRSARALHPAVHDEAPPPGAAWERSVTGAPLRGLDGLEDPEEEPVR